MATSIDDVKDLAPELDTEDDARLARFIVHANSYINKANWGAKADFARAVMAAHLITVSNRKGKGGAVDSEKAGDLSRSYSEGVSKDELGTTSYGQLFISMRRSIVLPMVIT